MNDDLVSEPLAPPVSLGVEAKIVMIVMVSMHLACFAVYFSGFSWPALWVALIMYVVKGMGVTTGYHRLLAHRSFKTNRIVQFLLTFAGGLAMQGGPLWWVAHHRSHHRDTDKIDDIHSPVTKGMWQSHMGWMMSNNAFHEQGSNARDLYNYPELKLLQRHYVWILIFQVFALYSLGYGWASWFPESGASGLQFLVWGFFVSTVFTWHVTFSVNSICHRWGARDYDAGDASTNNVVIGFLAFGEGWHNNHHFYPSSARHGLRWWQFDPTWILIRGLCLLGLASEPKIPKEFRDP
jgi:stearoyl-CoA desaturase (delta-9 desaturase)